jgi:hypothetical protein
MFKATRPERKKEWNGFTALFILVINHYILSQGPDRHLSVSICKGNSFGFFLFSYCPSHAPVKEFQCAINRVLPVGLQYHCITRICCSGIRVFSGYELSCQHSNYVQHPRLS